jgi:hypothetical protein
MKITKYAILAAGASLLLSAGAVFAKNPKSPADNNGLNKGKSDMQHLYLYEKDQTDWFVLEDGAWGKMSFDSEDFVFNGHMLEPGVDYTLVRYLDPWESHEIVCLGTTGVTDEKGNVHIKGDMLPGGPKVWLVLTADVDCENHEFTAWNGSEYLYEYDLIDGLVYVAFESGGTHFDSWWETIDGVHYEYRADHNFQFHPSDFHDCDLNGLTSSWNWTYDSGAYTDLGGDVGDLGDFLTDGEVYHVCMY